MNTIFVITAVSSLGLDFALRIFAFDGFYCQHLIPEHFKECKGAMSDNLFRHLIIMAIIMRIYIYAMNAMREFANNISKDDYIGITESLL